MKSLNEFLNENEKYFAKVGNIPKKALSSTEELRDFLEAKTKNGIVEYEEGYTQLGKDIPSAVSIYTYDSSSKSSLGSQIYITLLANDGKLYLRGFRSVNGEAVNKALGNKLKKETMGLSTSSDYFGSRGFYSFEINPKDVDKILDMINKATKGIYKSFADFYANRSKVD